MMTRFVVRKVMADTVGPSHRHDPWTSRAAAFRNSLHSGTQRTRVLLALAEAGEHGLTDYELHVKLSILRTAAGTRRDELRKLGLVVATQRVRPTDTGALAIVWVVTPLGRQVARDLDGSE